MHNSKDNEKTIAIIDDEEIVTDSIYNLLIFETEYNVICFNNPIKAIEELKHRHIDLIVCDVFMKEMNGIEVLKELRSYHPNVPLIMLTGYADKENTIKAINELSLYYYIEKPWDNDELLLVIKNGIEKGNLIEELRNKMQELESAYVQLEETQDELIKKEKFSTIGNMASKIIHDLKNPMSAISGFAELIIKTSKEKKDDETYKEIREFAQIIMDEVKRVIGMITEVLQFAKGEEVYRKAALPLTDIIQDTVSAISDKFEKDNIQIELEIASNKSTMEIDHDKIMRMMYNLLNNSRDAMPDGGKIKIRVERVNKDTLLLSISDNGKGMPEDIRSSIFEPFISYGKPNGTGLGMPIVKKIVEAHKGHIYVESVEGKGTTVDIYFKTPYTDAIQKEEVTELNKE